jgi:hypothetical protein
MRPRTAGWLLVLALGLGRPISASAPNDPSWDALKSLVGSWETTRGGERARVSYALISNGTALLETLETSDSTQMVTVYHRDGASLLLTHYCSANNQSRMRSPGLRAARLEFAYVDATNLKSSDETRMTRLVLSLPDPNHLVQEWTAKGGDTEHGARHEFTRKK